MQSCVVKNIFVKYIFDLPSLGQELSACNEMISLENALLELCFTGSPKIKKSLVPE